MCGRFANGLQPDQYRQAVRNRLPRNVRLELDDNAEDYRPGHNVAPQTRSPVVRLAEGGGSGHSEESAPAGEGAKLADSSPAVRMQTMKWGLVPKSAKVPPTGLDAARTINARDDTITSPHGSMWAPLFPAQRAVVFIQGFYEWEHRERQGGKEDVIAHFIGSDEEGQGRKDRNGKQKRLMALAGLWEKVRFHGDSEDTWTFTLVTTSANKQMHFHERMPVILPDERSIALWLGLSWSDETSSAVTGRPPLKAVAALMRPYAQSLEVYPCPREVGRVGNDSPQFILPISERKDGIMAAFKRAEKKGKAGGDKTADASKVENGKEKLGGEDVLESQEKGVSAAKLTEPQANTGGGEATPRKRSSSPAPSSSKRQRTAGTSPSTPSSSRNAKFEPSSRFSPDPWNPPVDDQAHRNAATPSKGGRSTKTSPKKKALEQAAKGTKDIRSFFG